MTRSQIDNVVPGRVAATCCGALHAGRPPHTLAADGLSRADARRLVGGGIQDGEGVGETMAAEMAAAWVVGVTTPVYKYYLMLESF